MQEFWQEDFAWERIWTTEVCRRAQTLRLRLGGRWPGHYETGAVFFFWLVGFNNRITWRPKSRNSSPCRWVRKQRHWSLPTRRKLKCGLNLRLRGDKQQAQVMHKLWVSTENLAKDAPTSYSKFSLCTLMALTWVVGFLLLSFSIQHPVSAGP